MRQANNSPSAINPQFSPLYRTSCTDQERPLIARLRQGEK